MLSLVAGPSMLGIGCRGRHALPLTPAKNTRTVKHPPRAGSFLGRTRLVIVAPPNGSLLALCDDVLAVGHIPDSEASRSRRAGTRMARMRQSCPRLRQSVRQVQQIGHG